MHQEVWRMSCSFVCSSVSEVNIGFERSISASSFLLCLYFCKTVWKKFLLWLHFLISYCFMNLRCLQNRLYMQTAVYFSCFRIVCVIIIVFIFTNIPLN